MTLNILAILFVFFILLIVFFFIQNIIYDIQGYKQLDELNEISQNLHRRYWQNWDIHFEFNYE